MHSIRLRGARTHHLQGVDLDLVPGELVAVTGLSGAGKSSLAFDTLYAEGQRRFVESFSPYARQFLERLERPPMDELDPVAAGVAVDRRAPIKSSRSTLATMADVEAYFNALFTREAVPICSECDVLAIRAEPASAARALVAEYDGGRAIVSYPVRVDGTEEYLGVREQLLRDGYRRLLVEGKTRDLDDVKPTEALAVGSSVDVVVDRLKLSRRNRRRLGGAIEQAWSQGAGHADVHLMDAEPAPRRLPAVRGLACPSCGKRFAPPTSGLFSYQSPVGACPECRGFGRVLGIDWAKVIPDESQTLAGRAIRPWSGKKAVRERRALKQFCEREGISLHVPWAELDDLQRRKVIDGEGTRWRGRYPGVRAWFRWLETKSYKMHVRVFLARYRAYDPCPVCQGKRLSQQSLRYRIDGLDLGQWHALELRHARARLEQLSIGDGHGEIARSELVSRLGYLERVGLGYLSIDRQARTLSGGEAQRVSLTAALGTSLTGALFVLDEPTVGLHSTDLPPLIGCMRQLAERGNAVLVVEHDPAVIAAADRVIEIGPGAGPAGGRVVFDGSPTELAKRDDLPTGRALRGEAGGAGRTPPPTADESKRANEAAGDRGAITVVGARAHNLANVTASFPLGQVVAVCGPSGSGKSTLVEEVLYRALARARGYRDIDAAGRHQRIEGATPIRTVTLVNAAPLGRTSRGNAATYTGAWTRFRAMFAAQPAAVLRELGPAHFSFNVAGGRCEACAGEGAETVEMQFLADVRLTCPVCRGRRFREEVLDVELDGLDVAEVLAMTVGEALERFDLERGITKPLTPLAELGLDYLPLGQPLSTLSGGEAQRLKLARSLKEAGEGTLILLDEPSAGLHPEEVGLLNGALRALVERGASVVVVDHDLGVLRAADWVLELGPGGGAEGGRIVAEGTPRQIAEGATRTGRALAGQVHPSPRAEPTARAAATGRARARKAGPPKPPLPQRAIEVSGAREHNLVDVEVAIPHGKLVVVTGPSGSGKSTLAFDVVFAEGQRRFLETLTPYARQFLPTLPRPDIDRAVGLPPSVALEQRLARAGANSTVATVTEIAHYLRLLFAKVGELRCPDCDEPVMPSGPDEVYADLSSRQGRWTVRAPVVRGRKGSYLDVFTEAALVGIERAWVDGALVSTDQPPRLNKRKEHDIDLIVFEGELGDFERGAFERALLFGRGQLVVARSQVSVGARRRSKGKRKGKGKEAGEAVPWLDEQLLSTVRACPSCGLALPELDPRWFSFNTRQGQCEACDGVGLADGVAVEDWGDDEPETCPECEGARLSPIPRAVRLFGERYHEHAARSVSSMLARAEGFCFSGTAARIAEAPLAELLRRLRFVDEVGLGYLSLDRPAETLSGGEMQRLRLAAQLGSGLTGALYVLDEPTVGLHPQDTGRLLRNLRGLVDMGSTVVVVEHDADTIRAADHLIDLGPGGGRDGGRVVAVGAPSAVLADPDSPTGKALRGERELFLQRERRAPDESKRIVLRGARANNLCIDELRIPADCLCVVAGVSGSGKSTLVRQVLYAAARRALGLTAPVPGAHQSLELPDHIGRAVSVDQSPMGRTPRSVPATFLGIWDDVRKLFAGTPEARAEGYKPARFSFNSNAGGRCEACGGMGVIAHEMAFLPDVKTRCEACGGLRFEPATLDVRYRGLSVGDVLRLTAEEALEVFGAHARILRPLQTLCDLGVGYVQLGQGSPTLSGGEAQRLKLAAEMTAGRAHKPTLYVLDEPTTGLHHSDVGRLIQVLSRMVDRGDSLIVIEHHPAVIAAADEVIELGPGAGEEGGTVVAQGSPGEVAQRATPTGAVLAGLLPA
ncbi:MAG: excinuclease ABC subunit UvrA [Deltaproteobacteria bacterium]|jgi:excinuclease ABC subunit A|nr:excinuclease ABC subunit UvrA [Deltaproteobacteria bacterium]MBW2534178.1 excinuclease ABC subunit UvrA [Deltaproteobacteria bacterium]